MREVVQQVNEIVRGWVAYFRVGNSADVLQKVKHHVERTVRRFACKKRGRKGFGWKRWSSEVVYGTWGLYNDYTVRPIDLAKVGLQPRRIITPV